MDESQKYDVEGKKSDTKEHLLRESMMKSKSKPKQTLMLEVWLVVSYG